MNDLNVVGVSCHFTRVLSGQFPPAVPRYNIGSRIMTWRYYITDGIYQLWRIFAKALGEVGDDKTALYNRNIEAVRKCVERVFGVLYRRFKLLYISCECWTMSKIQVVCKAAVSIHNMIVEIRIDRYNSDDTAGRSQYFESEEPPKDIVITAQSPRSTPLFAQAVVPPVPISR